MPSRLSRPLLIALFACLQLVLQPLAMSAPCSWIGSGGADCCCAPAETDEGAPASCCSSESESEAPQPASSERCECAVAPVQPPATTPELVESVRDPIALGVALCVPAWDEWVGAEASDRIVSTARAPGDGPPRHLRLQVFRL